MKPVVTALVFTVLGAAFVIISAILRIFHIIDRPTGYVLLGVGVVLGLIGGFMRRRAAKK
ncbi:hypothetical protein [Rufibacter roseus]|uniref:LPXTG cell wall anchor domain-containing protein n=1 Tax=Rufibacter roseus TaxID=1567108 RepID=A0ABW2DIB5_9BACT|nr:hypothetical protein [Rufibacter roseus]